MNTKALEAGKLIRGGSPPSPVRVALGTSLAFTAPPFLHPRKGGEDCCGQTYPVGLLGKLTDQNNGKTLAKYLTLSALLVSGVEGIWN